MPKVTNMTKGEEVLFSKYYGQDNLQDNDAFWEDVIVHLNDYDVVLPMEYTPENVRVLHGLIDCQPGACGECCRYGQTPIYEYDIHRLTKSGATTMEKLQTCVYTRKDGSMFMRGEPAGADCPLLENNVCTVYDNRPDVCWLFPVMKGPRMIGNKGMVRYRLKCKPAVDVAKTIFKGALSVGGYKLLPNLTIIKEENYGTNSKSYQ